MSAGFSRMEMTPDEGIEARRDGCRLRGERGALVSHAISLQRLVVGQCVTRTIAGFDCHERVGIGGRRVSGVQIVIDNDAVNSKRPTRHLSCVAGVGAGSDCNKNCLGSVSSGSQQARNPA